MSGRPSDYNEQIADIICERMVCGTDDKPESLRSICRSEGMPSLGTVMRWLAKHPQFRLQYASAREAQAEVHQEEILKISDNCTDDVTELVGNDEGGASSRLNPSAIARARLQVDSRKWIMSKMVPKKYGDKTSTEISGPDGGPIVTANKSDDELNRRILELSAKAGAGGTAIAPGGEEAPEGEE